MKKAHLFGLICTIFLVAYHPKPEEGMYPISFVGGLDLEKLGYSISANDLINNEGTGLVNAIVNLNGCTGSFVSNKGLVLTNHHCIFSSLRQFTTTDKNYMRDGFLAKDHAQELPIPGYSVKIMQSYDDISAKVLDGVDKAKDALERAELIGENIKALQKAEEEKYPEMEITIAEMLVGSSYYVFRYSFLQDVRLVYVPARYIGEFGGETDNWMWPRHSGDFAFVRAYTGPNGESAAYSKENLPYKPKKWLQVNPDGVMADDRVFILGYPGRTFRHYPAEYINYMQTVQMPYIAETWGWQIDYLENLAKQSEANNIKYSNRIKRLANTQKNYRGKMQSLRRIGLYESKKEEENMILSKLQKMDKQLASKYQSALAGLNNTYREMMFQEYKGFWFGQLRSASNLHTIANVLATVSHNYDEYEDPDDVIKQVIASLRKEYRQLDPNTELAFTEQLMLQGLKLELPQFKELVGETEKEVSAYVKASYAKNKIADSSYVFKMLNKRAHKLHKIKDPYMALHMALYDEEQETRKQYRAWYAAIDELRPVYVDAKMKAKGELFIPDANSTLRFTYGSIKGYAPSDGVYASPVTTLDGILEKGAKGGEYALGEELKQAILSANKGPFYQEALGSVPVNILYNTDTSGGNSGSPIMDKDGNIVGLNFDRVFEACVNDFAWDDDYSRSIGIDIRYILWVANNVDGANHLVTEMTPK